MTHPHGRLAFVLVCLIIVLTGCDLLGAAPTASPPPASAEATQRPRRTQSATSTDDGASAEPTRRPRRPRRSVEPSVAPTATPEPTPRPTPMPPIDGFARIAGSDGRFTVLLLGSDARGKVIGERTDAIIVATIDPTTGRVAMASLPRDTVNVPIADGEVYASRITGLLQSFELGGADREQALRRMKRAMATAFDTEIDAYVLVGFVGVRRLIDAIGGVDVFMDRALWDTSMLHYSKKGLKLRAGRNHLDGSKALAFARTRHTDSDYQRAGRQQQLVMSTVAKVLDNGPDAVPALAELALRHVETDLPLSALPVLVELAGRARLNSHKSMVLGPSTYAGDGPELYTIELKLDAVRAMFDRLFGPIGS